MCMPREPEVFGQPTSPKSSSVACTMRATSRTCAHVMPGTGSRSTRSSSGWSRSSARTGCGCSSRHARFAIHASAAASRGTTSSAVRPDGKCSGHDVDPRRPRLRRALLIEELLRRCRSDSARARWAVLPRRAARRRPRRGSSARGPAWCGRPEGTGPCAGWRSPPRARRPRALRCRSCRPCGFR